MDSFFRFAGLAVSVAVVIFFLSLNAHAGPGACRVSVVTTMKSGKVKKRIFNTKAGTEADCAEDATLQSTNFFPPKIAKKEVEYRFGDGPAVLVKDSAR